MANPQKSAAYLPFQGATAFDGAHSILTGSQQAEVLILLREVERKKLMEPSTIAAETRRVIKAGRP